MNFQAAIHIVPGSIMPEQFWHHQTAPRSGEQRLLSAILEEALLCLWNYRYIDTPKGRRLFAEAYEWAISDDVSYLCTFRNVCHHIGVNPDDLQPKIKRRFGPYYTPIEEKKERCNVFVVPELVMIEIKAKGNRWSDGYEVEVYGKRLQLPFQSLREQRVLEKGYQYNVMVSTYWAFKHGFLSEKPADFRMQSGEHQRHKIATPRQEDRGV